jgi:hypothetical protein
MACLRLKGRFGRKFGRPFAFLELSVARTIAYVDGFNLKFHAFQDAA